MSSRRVRNNGFTLIELLVVIAIIGILAAMAVSVGAGILTTAKKKRTVATINILKLALNAYYQEFQDYPPIYTDGTTSKSPQTKNSSSTSPWDQVRFKTGGAVTQVTIGSFNRSSDNEDKRRTRIEALFYFLTTKFRGVGNSPFISNPGDLNLVDIDGDGRPEIADAWDFPLAYYRPGLDHGADKDDDNQVISGSDNRDLFEIYSYGEDNIDDSKSTSNHKHGDDVVSWRD